MILEQIAMKTKERIRAAKEQLSLAEMRARALAMDCNTGFPFEKALAGKGIISLKRRHCSGFSLCGNCTGI